MFVSFCVFYTFVERHIKNLSFLPLDPGAKDPAAGFNWPGVRPASYEELGSAIVILSGVRPSPSSLAFEGEGSLSFLLRPGLLSAWSSLSF